ncbi:MAG: ribose-phosphate pyrophosphokinase [Bacteroidia bacterium]
MKTFVFALPGNEQLAEQITKTLHYEKGDLIIHHFPDGESYVRIESDVKNSNTILVCTLDRPDSKLIPLYFMAEILRDAGAEKVTLVAPYLAYMRQDKQFNPGECVTSEHFANLLSSFIDELVTIDPHLHRIDSLERIYSIPTTTLHIAPQLSAWIKANIENPLLIGPDSESKQWVDKIAKDAGAHYTVLKKSRLGDKKVKVSIPHIDKYRKTHTPVIVDDIISTGKTMIETIHHLKREGTKPPVCIGIHAVFAGDAYDKIKEAGAQRIVTSNTIIHKSNSIDINSVIVKALK